MLIERIELKREYDDDWVTEDDRTFACWQEFDTLFGLNLETQECDLLVFDSPEENCIRIDIRPIYEEINQEIYDSEKPVDFDLFCGGKLLTSNGSYNALCRKLHTLTVNTVWCKLD